MPSPPVDNQQIKEIQELPDTMNFNSGLVDGSLGFHAVGAIKLYQQFGAGGELENRRALLEDLRAVAATMYGKSDHWKISASLNFYPMFPETSRRTPPVKVPRADGSRCSLGRRGVGEQTEARTAAARQASQRTSIGSGQLCQHVVDHRRHGAGGS